ncbi:MAG: DUF4115 domain-containing protein [Thiopseudomonas sp.]|nr:DUF4115 domain-containing protein [Thiopseudomonas sp.]MCK9465875.1 DUF4115 domain-containing protein [Thiopseudomonas sp.]
MSNSDVDETTQADVAVSLLGATLRRARENKGLTLEAVAAQLNLRPATLQNLEDDRYDALPGTTFIRGYIRSYANALGLDGDVISKQYVQVEQPREGVKPLQNIERKSRARFFLISFLLLLIVIAGLAGYWWIEQKDNRQSQSDKQTLLEQVAIEGVDGTLHIQSLDELNAQTAGMDIEEIQMPTLEPEPESVVTAEKNVAATEPAAAVNQQDELELSFIQDSWVRVTDAQGNEIASGLKRAGEVLKLVGDGPFEIHLGYAKGVFITFNGQQVDFDSKIRGNIARIKLG